MIVKGTTCTKQIGTSAHIQQEMQARFAGLPPKFATAVHDPTLAAQNVLA
jgi:hypothetical protein